MTEFRYRSRQGGKIHEMAGAIAERSGLSSSVCAELLRHGWTYMEFLGKPSRWESPAAKIERPKPEVVGLSDEQWERIAREAAHG